MMKTLPLIFSLLLILGASIAVAQEGTAQVKSMAARVRFLRDQSTLLLDAYGTADTFGWQARMQIQDQLLVFCREEPEGLCVPLRLDRTLHRKSGAVLFVDANVLAHALRFTVVDERHSDSLIPNARHEAIDADLPAYNAEWGAGRGFHVGDTLPNIPLYNMDGQEVRFSQFLGKQYILYCWASW